jgi:hypothetical protein
MPPFNGDRKSKIGPMADFDSFLSEIDLCSFE